jgi:hypothetical protein
MLAFVQQTNRNCLHIMLSIPSNNFINFYIFFVGVAICVFKNVSIHFYPRLKTKICIDGSSRDRIRIGILYFVDTLPQTKPLHNTLGHTVLKESIVIKRQELSITVFSFFINVRIMKSWSAQIYFVVVVLVATSFFKQLHVSSASSTIQADTKRFFGLSSEIDTKDTDKKKKKKKRFFGSSFKSENNEKSDDAEDAVTNKKKKKRFFGLSENNEKSDDIEDTEDTVTDKKQKKKSSSWQFFNKNNELDDASGGEGDGDEAKTSTEKDEKKQRFQFQFRRQEKEIDEKDPKKNNEVNEEVGKKVDEELDIEDKNEQGEAKEFEKVEENDSESSSSSDKEDDDKSDSQTTKDDPQSDQDEERKKDEDKGKENNSQLAAQQYRNQLMMKQQLAQSPGTFFYRSAQPPQQGFPQQQQPSSPSAIPSAQGQIMAASAIVNVLGLVSRFFFIKWIINKLAFESESMSPTQHFMWECLNDKFVKDNEIWNRVLGRVPHSMNVSQRKWGNTVKAMGPDKIKLNKKQQNMTVHEEDDQAEQQKLTEIPETSKTVVVMDFSTMNVPDPDFLRFADVVTFLVGSNNPRKQLFGKKPEVVIILQSPGGEVTSFAFAAAQVARLRSAGWQVTVSVDRIAASGGYMIASQATQILASPFAMVGSIGVITETLNFYETLKKYGVKSLVLKVRCI